MTKLFSKNWSEKDFERIQKLISMASDGDAAEVEIEADGVRVVVRKHPSPTTHIGSEATVSMVPQPVVDSIAPAESLPTEASNAVTDSVNQHSKGIPILSPTPGTFYAKPAPDADAFVQVGDYITKGQTVCIIEAMKLMNEVEADRSGTVLEILVNDGDAVEYDQPLLLIEAS
ncbi:MAG: acetyl-CoA carboxylase biotin carboxyl carrier protein [Bacteroidetes bacterium]|nr:acetyl-CoA carboxylase biotin carboxyl carrier protein [Bacteroidota bacterium]MCY4234072.1 acetyl-CoA carboxylase biotin carboxyl carrier protein [Bacteroidota bacterium]